MTINLCQELIAKIYFFVLRPQGFIPNVQEKGIIIMAHTLEDAMTSAQTDHPQTSITFLTSTPFDDVMKQVNDNRNLWAKAEGEKPTAQPPPAPSMTLQTPYTFITGLKMASEVYVTNKTDQKTLNKIITKLEQQYVKDCE